MGVNTFVRKFRAAFDIPLPRVLRKKFSADPEYWYLPLLQLDFLCIARSSDLSSAKSILLYSSRDKEGSKVSVDAIQKYSCLNRSKTKTDNEDDFSDPDHTEKLAKMQLNLLAKFSSIEGAEQVPILKIPYLTLPGYNSFLQIVDFC